MKKHINLLHKNKKYREKEKSFYYLRRITVIVGVVTVCLVVVVFFISSAKRQEHSVLLISKERYLKELLTLKDSQEKVAYVGDKTEYLKSIAKKDSNFTAYYSILKQSLFDVVDTTSTSSALIEDMHFDSKQTIEFKINIFNDEALATFLGILESDNFINYFQTLELTKLTSAREGNIYALKIKGVFKPIKGNSMNL